MTGFTMSIVTPGISRSPSPFEYLYVSRIIEPA